jgi:hypothetical protein
MRRSGAGALILALALLAAVPAQAFVLRTEPFEEKMVLARWRTASFPMPMVLNNQPRDLLKNVLLGSVPLRGIEAAFATWEMAPVGFRLSGPVSITDRGFDGVNLISFADTSGNRDRSGNWIAACTAWALYYSGSNRRIRIMDADIIWNPRQLAATDGNEGAHDIQGILTHELGHALGLEHSPIVASTMYPFATQGVTNERTLHTDDIAGVRALYGLDSGPGTGTIAGRVVTTAGAPVFGAHVVALDAQGIVQVAARTDWEGNYTIPSLPAGSYGVYAEPLDGPATPANILGALANDSKHKVRRSFQTTFAGGNSSPASVVVSAGQTTAVDPISVVAEAATLNLTGVHWYRENSWKDAAEVSVLPGRAVSLLVQGTGVDTLGSGDFTFSANDVIVSSLRSRGVDSNSGVPYAILDIFVRPNARPGARTVFLRSGSQISALTGALEVAAL